MQTTWRCTLSDHSWTVNWINVAERECSHRNETQQNVTSSNERLRSQTAVNSRHWLDWKVDDGRVLLQDERRLVEPLHTDQHVTSTNYRQDFNSTPQQTVGQLLLLHMLNGPFFRDYPGEPVPERYSLQTDNNASTPPLSFLQAGCPITGSLLTL